MDEGEGNVSNLVLLVKENGRASEQTVEVEVNIINDTENTPFPQAIEGTVSVIVVMHACINTYTSYACT